MTRLNSSAENLWATYLAEIRAMLSSLNQEQVDEIVQELESHLDGEANSGIVDGEIGQLEMQAIVDRLGTPDSIAEAYGIEPESSRTVHPSDVALLFGSLTLLLVSTFLPLLQIVSIPASAIIARIALHNPNVMQSPYRWAGYPALVIFYFTATMLVLFWPLLPVLPIAATGGFVDQLLIEEASLLNPDSPSYWINVWSIAAFICGAWWLLLRHLLRNQRQNLKRLLFPFFQSASLNFGKYFQVGGLLLLSTSTLVIVVLRIG